MKNNKQHNLVMKFEGTRDEYERLLACFQSGELEKLLNLPIQDVRIVPDRQVASSEEDSPLPSLRRGELVAPEKALVPQVLQRVYNSLESGWQTLESLLDIQSPKLAQGWRSGGQQLKAKDVKLQKASKKAGDLEMPAKGFMRGIELDLLEVDQQVALIIALMPGSAPQTIDVRIEVCPMQRNSTLPPGLQLMTESRAGEPILSAVAEAYDPKISFTFTRNIGEPFSVKLAFNNFSYTQEFPI